MKCAQDFEISRALQLLLTMLLLWVIVTAMPTLAQEATLEVATFNVESDRDTDPAVVAQDMRQISGPVLWGLSEVPNRRAAETYARSARFPGSDFEVILGSSGGGDRLAFLYDANSLDLIQHTELEDIGGDRAPLVGEFRIRASGQRFLAAVNHFNRGNAEKRQAQASNFRDWAINQSLPVIALGDYNFDVETDTLPLQGNPAFDIFTASADINWLEPDCLSDPARPCPSTGTQCDPQFSSILDFIFLAGSAVDWPGVADIEFTNRLDYCQLETQGGSDHYPVVALISPRSREDARVGFSDRIPLAIAALLPNPTGDETQNEAAVILNTRDAPIDLTGWQLRDRQGDTWSLTVGGIVQPGETIEFRRLGQAMALSNRTDEVALVAPDGTIVDQVSYERPLEGRVISFR